MPIAAACVAAAEIGVARWAPILSWALQRVGFGPVARGLVRAALLLLFAARTTSTALTIWTAALALVIASAGALRGGTAQVITFLRTPPVLSRGLPLGVEGVPTGVQPWLLEPGGRAALIELPAAIGLAVSASGTTTPGFVGLLLSALIASGATAMLAVHALSLRRIGLPRRVSDEVQRRLLELGPEVAVYLGGGPDWRYQAEMWLATMERLDRRVIIVVRDTEVLRTLAPTTIPVICIRNGSALMRLDLPSLRIVLYVGNTADSIHMLRRRGVRGVFIGHGDSDKAASSNPYSRVYDEIWVAGQAGRDRYLNGGVAIPGEAIIEVGRPQLGELPRTPDAAAAGAADAAAAAKVTVLYAPTWDGWGDDPHHSSLPLLGPELIRVLLSRDDVRVMYRPHPMTGSREPAVRRAHEEVIRLMSAAGADASDAVVGPMPGAAPPAVGDLLDVALAGPSRWSRAEHRAEVDRWTVAYWAAHPGHCILTGTAAPDLHACFLVTDALIADISSVTTDFLAADRPYAVVNTTGAPADDFRRSAPSTSAGFVLGPDFAELDDLVAAAKQGPDPTAPARQRARAYLLGPRTVDPTETFRAQLDRIYALPRAHGEADLAIGSTAS